MKPILPVILVAALLAGCDGNPFIDTDSNPATPDGTTGVGNSAKSRMVRAEATGTGPDVGNGVATGISLVDPDPAVIGDETFIVDGLAFDGDNHYHRSAVLPTIGTAASPFQVYESPAAVIDNQNNSIPQFVYRAIYGASTTGATNFAIVRTGSFTDYGFGGFVYERKGGVTLPTTGQAGYSGAYAGLRDFNGAGGLEYVSGTMTMAIDFEDFNDSAGITGNVASRTIRDINGADITNQVLAALNSKLSSGDAVLTVLPELNFHVGPGVLRPSGEVSGDISSSYTKGGKSEPFEAGKFYALMSDSTGGNANEVVGIIRVTAEDPRASGGVTVRETGGFILYHAPPPP